MVNRYPAPCAACGTVVPANGGTLTRSGRHWNVRHLACASAGSVQVVEFRAGNWRGTRNVRGTCEDAPCCGCCTF